MYFFTLFTGWLAYLDKEAFGAHKGEEDDAYDGFGDHDGEESDDVEDDHANGAVLRAGLRQGGEGEH